MFDGRAVIDMELIEGETLAAMLARGPLPLAAALSVTQQLLDAVGYAHTRGIVHRDIKPDNVFVTAEGRIKLADFGIAHVGASATLTQAGTIMGTPGYMSPEQVTGDPVDARADIFAIGVVAYEAIVEKRMASAVTRYSWYSGCYSTYSRYPSLWTFPNSPTEPPKVTLDLAAEGKRPTAIDASVTALESAVASPAVSAIHF